MAAKRKSLRAESGAAISRQEKNALRQIRKAKGVKSFSRVESGAAISQAEKKAVKAYLKSRKKK